MPYCVRLAATEASRVCAMGHLGLMGDDETLSSDESITRSDASPSTGDGLGLKTADGATTTPERSAEPKPPPSGLNIPSFGDILKLLAILAGAIYGALFIGYREYFSELRLQPEDVGVDNTFIAQRSVGFILIAAVIAGAALLFAAFIRRLTDGDPWGRSDTGAIAALVAFIAVAAVITSALGVGKPVAYVFAAALMVSSVILGRNSFKSSRDRIIAACALMVTAVVVIVLPALAVYSAASDLAKGGPVAGKRVEPQTLFGMPLLDVSAEHVVASWICPDAQRPPAFSDLPGNTLSGILVGSTSTSYFIRPLSMSAFSGAPRESVAEIIEVPRNCALLTRYLYPDS